MIEVKRSPARVCWWIVVNGHMVDTRNTKCEALALRDSLAAKFGLEVA